MKAVWLEDRHLAFKEDIPVPTLPEGEAVIRVKLAGICSTDLEMVDGYRPFTGILGHEFVGEVVRCPAAPAWEGKRVVGEINAACRKCETCRSGLPRHCENRTVLGIEKRQGVFAEYVTLPIENLHKVPENVPDQAAVFTEPLAAALEIQEQIKVEPGMRVIVIGAGRLGLLVAFTLALTGCELRVIVRQPRPLQILAAKRISTLTSGEVPAHSADLVVEATGSPEGLHQAMSIVRPRGTIILKSTYAGTTGFDFSAVTVNEINILGSRCGPFEPALRLLETGQVDPTPLIETCYPLEEALAAFEHAARRGVLKVLFSIGESRFLQ
jgi:threonine dehydrogenase-like Zn-dependent dehydrogenase